MEYSDIWSQISTHLNGSSEAEIKSRLATLLNMQEEEVTAKDLIEALICHLESNCTQSVTLRVEHTGLQNAVKIMGTILLPVILFLGISGNAVSISAFVLCRLRRAIHVHFLVAITVVDVGFLISLLLVWLEKYHAGFNTSEGLCQLTIYVSYVCTYLSVWFMLALSLERFLVVCVYSCKQRFCSTATAKTIICGLSFCAGVIYLYLTWTSGVVAGYGVRICSPLPQFVSTLTTVSEIETILGILLPYALICVLNLLLLCSISKQSKAMEQAQCSPEDTISIATRDRHLFQLRASRLAIVLSFVSVVLCVPCHVHRLRAMFLSSSTGTLLTFSENEFLWQEMLQYLFYAKASTHIFIYSFFARDFRKALKSLLVRLKMNYLPCCSGLADDMPSDMTLEMERYAPVPDLSASVT